MFPAPAGINRVEEWNRCATDRVPRASGDKPVNMFIEGVNIVCSPRQRG